MINQENIPVYWNVLETLLDEQPERWNDMYTKEGIKQRLLTGINQFWVAGDVNGIFLGMLTEINLYESGRKDLFIKWVGGEDMVNLLDYFFIVEEWARHTGCTHVVASGRLGLARVLKNKGFTIENVMISKKVDFRKDC